MYALLGYLKFLKQWDFLHFLVEPKLYIVKIKLSTVKHLQFYPLKDTYNILFESMGDKNLENPNVDGFEIYARKSV